MDDFVFNPPYRRAVNEWTTECDWSIFNTPAHCGTILSTNECHTALNTIR